MPVITSRPPMAVGEHAPPIPESGRAVVGHVDALYRGDIDTALNFVSADVENVVSDTKSFMHFPKGKAVTKAMYLSITRKGELSLTHFDCKPESTAVRCDMMFGSGEKLRRFTLRYFADRNGPISRIYSWEIHSKRS